MTRRHGVLLVIDETHTLCAGPGGCTAAWGLEPDFVVVGKPIGGGVPVAAYGMTAEVADRLSGRCRATRSTWPASAARSPATPWRWPRCGPPSRPACARRTSRWRSRSPSGSPTGVAGVIAEHGLPWHVQRLGCRAEYWFCPPPRDGAAAAAAVDEDLEGFLHLWCLNRGCC